MKHTSQEKREIYQELNEMKRALLEKDNVSGLKSKELTDLQSELTANEAEYYAKVKEIQKSIKELKTESLQG